MPLIKIEQDTLQERIEVVKIHYQNGENFSETVRKVKIFPGLLGGYVNKQSCRIRGWKTQK